MKIDGKKIIGYREAMVLPQRPQKLLVVGSGAIGVEFAYFYSTIGTEVTISMSCGIRHALLTETLENTAGFTQFRFMPVQTADEILTSIHQTHDNDFEGLWATL